MPRKDPMTGVMVMTDQEFAMKEGYGSATKMYMKIFDDMDKDNRSYEKCCYAKPKIVENAFKEHWKDDLKYGDVTKEEKKCIPVKIVQVLYVKSNCGFNKSHIIFVAAFICKDGKTRIQQLDHYHYVGSKMEPPEDEYELDIFE